MGLVEDGTSYHPEFCPVTGRPFFMTIEGEDGKMVATYGGPFDSYTIPVWDEEDGEFRSERYDHDAGQWVEGGEPYSFVLCDEQELIEKDEIIAAARRDGAIEALEALRCWNDDTHAPECLTLDADEREMFGLCPRCKALAALKGGK